MRLYAALLERDRELAQHQPRDARPLVVLGEDDQEIREALAEILTLDGFEVAAAPDGEGVIELLSSCALAGRLPDLVVVDHRMPVYSGLDILDGLRLAGWDVPVVLVTAFGGDVESIAQALGARAVFQKPFELDDLRTAIAYLLDGQRDPTRNVG